MHNPSGGLPQREQIYDRDKSLCAQTPTPRDRITGEMKSPLLLFCLSSHR